ncbi:hypothetical protein HDU86_001108 [Geranomyces michiganensis]|nr:hypothetical protein HDU86_001108 [Geranomyces michiganensis]
MVDDRKSKSLKPDYARPAKRTAKRARSPAAQGSPATSSSSAEKVTPKKRAATSAQSSPAKRPRSSGSSIGPIYIGSSSDEQEKAAPLPDNFLDTFFVEDKGPPTGQASAATSETGDATIGEAIVSDSDEDEEDWEELGAVADMTGPAILEELQKAAAVAAPAPTDGFEISIKKPEPRQPQPVKKAVKARGIRKRDRIRRLIAHKLHLLSLTGCGLLRNHWVNDPQLQAAAVSVVPRDIHNALSGKDTGKGKLSPRKHLLHYLSMFSTWWKEHVKVRDMPNVPPLIGGAQGLLRIFHAYVSLPADHEDKFVASEYSALFFAAACRGLGLKTRVLYSLHPLPLSLSKVKGQPASVTRKPAKGKAPSKGKRGKSKGKATKRKRVESSDSEERDSGNESDGHVSRPATLRNAPNVHRKPTEKATAKEYIPYPLRCWCEVLSGEGAEWIPVDPVHNLVNDAITMEPKCSGPIQLQLSYVVAYEPDFGIKDVTRKYTTQWGARTARLRLPAGIGGEDWWQRSLWFYSKSTREQHDAVEDKQLRSAVFNEAMPKSLAGFKNHPLYALERHLLKYEAIYPIGPEHQVGVFKGEPVYKRSSVQELHTKEAWLKLGRQVLPDEEPAKHVKARVATINRMRKIEAEILTGASTDSSKSATYGLWQTVEYRAPPIGPDGKIPKNSFGNIELFHENMLPPGAVHLPWLARLAKKLGIDYASAVTGFDFHKGRSTPVIAGIVVADQYEEILMAAFAEDLNRKRKAEGEKLKKRVYNRWARLISGLMTKERLIREYMVHNDGDEHATDGVVLVESGSDEDGLDEVSGCEVDDGDGNEEERHVGTGFFVDDDDEE